MTVTQTLAVCAAPEAVFDALIDPQKLQSWWGAEPSIHYQRWSVDARPCGLWRCEGSDASCGPYVTRGEILTLDPPHLLRLSWIEELERGNRLGPTEVAYIVQPSNDGAVITVNHTGFENHEAIGAEYQQGWAVVLGLLKSWLEAPK
jgi:uncharacterized protein YndB with AHSA1/START domain